ncbi:hypothetical protein DUNSADRAFT_6366 [Dunaliella salina]|uniref:Steroid 5-alpha reductase C-terminal domain-containing protein n=1 Tax=Dunaliella salina TaxID=3046 RepID=A0ABQ7GNG9_DUNSA|nr:hypothetical protein DUNSADRAFT_6366 [Dunaliella salina]|eukprot:KAF5836113.1 hypothetical protein DUNSADRAFT_6366 [Dunaliella salina]
MALYVGRDVRIPAVELELPGVEAVLGTVIRATRATRWYPNGRVEIGFQDGSKRMVPVDDFKESWLLDSNMDATAAIHTPVDPSLTVPSSRRKSTTAASTRNTPSRTPSRTRHRTPSRTPSRPYADQEPHLPQNSTSESRKSPKHTPPASKASTPALADACGTNEEEFSFASLPKSAQDLTPPQMDARSRAGLASSPPPSLRQRRSSAFSTPTIPSTPTLQSALKKGMMRTPSMKRVSFTGMDNNMSQVTTTPRISVWANMLNFFIMIAVALPALKIGIDVCSLPAPGEADSPLPMPKVDLTPANLTSIDWWLQLGYWKPLLFVNLLAFFNVDVLFWIVAQIQGTTWLIDPYWTLIPLLIQIFYQYHPLAEADAWRGLVVSSLLRLWSLRLTISYLRREDWQFGAREDWRYTNLAKQYGRIWPVLSFFATYLVQHVMLVGITLPLYAVFTSAAPWNLLDTVAAVLTAAGMAISYTADNQLNAFMRENQHCQAEGMPVQLILDSGLWRFSRHPNYFGEQLFWWALSLFAVRLGQPWMVVGTLFNSLCMIPVTMMTEGRMLARPERAELFKEYQRTTSVWVPWFKKT